MIFFASSFENPADFSVGPFGNNDPVTVTWTLYDGQDNKINETTETLEGGDEATFESSAMMPITIDWRLEIALDSDENVNTATIFDVSYDHSVM